MSSKPSRYSRDEFLARSLDVLSQDGESKLRIDRLVDQLGVTKGSFYWHFENRADFVRSLADYWARSSTQVVIDDLETMAGSPEDRLFSQPGSGHLGPLRGQSAFPVRGIQGAGYA